MSQQEAKMLHIDKRLQTQVVETLHGRHLVVERYDGKDGITWEQLQQAKNEALGHDAVAVEIYPAEDDVVNEVNRRHLWEIHPDVVEWMTIKRGS